MPSLVLEWAEGRSIKECKKFGVNDFLIISHEILYALKEIHANQVIHNNLTADHIIVNSNPVSAKIIGFGLSSQFDCKFEPLEGYFHLISPEQVGWQNRAIDFCTDFYNLGVVFYFMLSGKLPFNSIFEQVKPLNLIDPLIPAPVAGLVSKLMEKNPENRYQSAKEILYDIELMLANHKTDILFSSIT